MPLCGGKNDSGVRFTTMGHGSDVFDRGCVVAHEGYVGLEAARALPKAKFAITHKTRVWFH